MNKQIRLGEKYLGKLNLDSPGTKQRIGKGKILTHISLFSGCGGMDVGMSNAGIHSRVMVEWDKSCCNTLRTNFAWEELKKRTKEDGSPQWKYKSQMKKSISWYHYPEPVIMERDITKVSTKEILEAAKLQIGECSVISGGFPCQGFSLAGERNIGDKRNELYEEFVRIVDEAKPARFIGENVPGLVSMAKGEIMQKICEDFANCGYDISWDILNAADYGVPQHRKRVILIGSRIDAMKFDGDRTSFHLGAAPGEILHPHIFYERLKRWKAKELLKKIEEDPRCSFKEKKK